MHSFDPPSASPVSGPFVDLEVSEIEDAGIREVLQTPGAAYGAWSMLDALLAPTGSGTPFVFREPLGQARGDCQPPFDLSNSMTKTNQDASAPKLFTRRQLLGK